MLAVQARGNTLILFCHLSPPHSARCFASCKRCGQCMYGRPFNGLFMLYRMWVAYSINKPNEVLRAMIETTPYTPSHQQRASRNFHPHCLYIKPQTLVYMNLLFSNAQFPAGSGTYHFFFFAFSTASTEYRPGPNDCSSSRPPATPTFVKKCDRTWACTSSSSSIISCSSSNINSCSINRNMPNDSE